MKTIRNDFIKVSSVPFGAQLMSIKSLKTDREFLWQGDKNIWSERSPLLFPIVGRAMNDRIKINGNEYPIKMHGYAKDSEFKTNLHTSDTIEYLLTENNYTLSMYPYKYNLYVVYTLSDNKLKITYKVENTDNKTIYFSIGAHPGFNCEIGDVLEFEQNETLKTNILNNEHYIGSTLPYLNNEKIITITENTFDNDALIFEQTKSKAITLKSKKSSYSIKFTYNEAPYLGIWSKPNAPYVCIEPWYGADDTEGTDYEFCDKPTSVKLGIGKTFEYNIQIEFFE